ncbi:MAG: aspartyl protease family protein [Blastocatellia bacterium]
MGLAVAVCGAVSGLAVEIEAQSRGKLLKQAEKEVRQANFPVAETLFQQLLERNSSDRQARLGLSFVQIKRGNLGGGYEQAAKVLAADPLNSRAHALLGTALLRAGEFRNSIESLYTAVKLNEREALAIAGLSEIEYFENRAKNSYAGLKRAVLLDPSEPDYYISLARTCSRLEYYNEAADAFQRFLDVSPKTDAERRARIKGLIDLYRYLGTTKIHRTAGKEVSTVQFNPVNHRPFIEVQVNGKGPLRFVIDTGASLTVISDKAAERLGIKPVARGGNARAIGGSGSFPIVYGLLDSLSIGDVRIDLVPVYIRTVYSSPDLPESDRADGYLGLSVLSNFAVTLDYQTRQLTLDRSPISDLPPAAASESSSVPAEIADPFQSAPVRTETDTEQKGQSVVAASGSFEVPIRSTSGGLASTEATLPGVDRPLNLIIDTGATVSVISSAAVQQHALEGLITPGVTYRVIGAAGISEGAKALGLSTLAVNGLRKNQARALILDLSAVNETSGFEQHGVLGADFLSHFRVVLDMRRYQFRLTPQSPAITVAAPSQ